jgi:hypothetical protein
MEKALLEEAKTTMMELIRRRFQLPLVPAL